MVHPSNQPEVSAVQQLASLSLKTQRLEIRRLIHSDLSDILDIHSVQKVNRFIPYQTWQNMDDALTWFDYVEQRRADDIAEQFVIIRLSDQRLVGTCLAFDFDAQRKEIEFGYVLSPKHWGQGYLVEAMQGFTAALSDTLALNSVKACVDKANTASLNLLTKLGFEVDKGKPNDKDAGLLVLRKHDL